MCIRDRDILSDYKKIYTGLQYELTIDGSLSLLEKLSMRKMCIRDRMMVVHTVPSRWFSCVVTLFYQGSV